MWKCPKCETLNDGDSCIICGELAPETYKKKAHRKKDVSKNEQQVQTVQQTLNNNDVKIVAENTEIASKKKKWLPIFIVATVILSITTVGFAAWNLFTNTDVEEEITYREDYDISVSFNDQQIGLQYPLIDNEGTYMISEHDFFNMFGIQHFNDDGIIHFIHSGLEYNIDTINQTLSKSSRPEESNVEFEPVDIKSNLSVATIKNNENVVMIPLRECAEFLGATVSYNQAQNLIAISTVSQTTEADVPNTEEGTGADEQSGNGTVDTVEKQPEPTKPPASKSPVKAKCPTCGSTSHTVHPKCPVCGSTSHTTHPKCPVCGSTSHTTHPKCPVCGSTSHTTHPKCPVCGSTSHTTHPKCPVCGSTSHTSHPKCSVCGSTSHTVHPKCPTCGSTAHTVHPSSDVYIPPKDPSMAPPDINVNFD